LCNDGQGRTSPHDNLAFEGGSGTEEGVRRPLAREGELYFDKLFAEAPEQWHRLHVARGGTCLPHFYKWLGTGPP